MEIVELNPLEIKVIENTTRYRKEMGDVESLADSFKRTRQILPIVINRKHELIDGGRRLAACMLAGIKVKCVYEETIDLYELRELELEANLHRKDFSPGEYAIAVADLHRLKQEKYGVSKSGSTEGWSIEQTARLLGKTRGSVYNALENAALIDVFPELMNAKKASEIRKAGKSLETLNTVMKGIKHNEQNIRGNDKVILLHRDAVEDMEARGDNSVDIICTDPIYGIDADLITTRVGGRTGVGTTTSGYVIEDRKEDAFFYYRVLAKQGFRITSTIAHGFIFLAPEHFWDIRAVFLDAGWRVYVKPIIWIKRSTGQCNVPHAWPASCYEMLMYIRKDNSRLIKEGMPDWVECNPVDPSKRMHPFEKPVPLLKQLLERVSLPQQTLYDPFMGSGSSIEAGLSLNLNCIGVDNLQEAYASACSRIAEIK